MADLSPAEQRHQAEVRIILTASTPAAAKAAWLKQPSGVNGGTNLHKAAKCDALGLLGPDVMGLLTRDDLLALDRDGNTPLKAAVLSGRPDQLKGLLGARILTYQDLFDFKSFLLSNDKPKTNPRTN